MDIGRRVREARAALGYTQEELADAVALNREAIVNIENGKRKVSADELWRIAREMEQPLLYFLQDATAPRLNLTVVALRGGAGATRQVKRGELWLRRHFDDYQQLLRILARQGRPDVSLGWRQRRPAVEEARSAAALQRSHHGLGDEEVRDIRGHLEEHVGVPVFGRDIGDLDFCGMLIVARDIGAAVMLVNGSLLTSRRNFTMAHEYGHLLWKLKRSEPTADVFYRSPGHDEEEIFANAFAAHFLAPDRPVRDDAARLGVSPSDPNSVMKLAARFGVSFQTMTYRLQNLGLLSPAQASALREATAPTALPSFRWERQAFYGMSPLYWRFVLEAYNKDELDAARCGEMVDMSALEFEELLKDFEEDLITDNAMLEAAS